MKVLKAVSSTSLLKPRLARQSVRMGMKCSWQGIQLVYGAIYTSSDIYFIWCEATQSQFTKGQGLMKPL